MGDRANIYLRDSDRTSGMYLYTHSGAQSWPGRLQEALNFGRSRWDDPNYLARIITLRVFADLISETIGGGLGTQLGDNDDYPLLCVDLLGQRIGLCDIAYCEDCDERITDPRDMDSWRYVVPFQKFCDLDLASELWGWWGPCPDPALN